MASRKRPSVKLARFTVEYINERRDHLMSAVGKRNSEMDKYESMYRLNVWETDKPEGEQRITLPLAYDMVEKQRSMIFARPFQLSVPATGNLATDRNRAQKLENYLYGVRDRCSINNLADLAEWNASCLQRGWIKAVYDPTAAEDEFPILVTTPDPRACYYTLNSRGDGCSEFIHTYERSRRDIEADWDISLPDAPSDPDQLDQWLDEMVCYTEYWAVEVVWEAPQEEAADADTEEPTTPGVIQLAAEDYMRRSVAANAPPTTVAGQPTPTIGDYLEVAPASASGAGSEVAKKPERQRVRKIVHAVMVGEGDEAMFVKKPVVMIGYKHIPFFGWAGIETPMSNGRASLSILYAATGGDGGDKASGILEAYNLVASLYLDEAVRRVHAPLVTDDGQADIDLSPDAINQVAKGSNLTFLQQPPVNNALQVAGDMMSRMLDRIGSPEVLNGQVFNLSGQAISGMANQYQMRIASAQHRRELALSRLFEHILCLTAHYSDDRDGGWRAYGTGKYGAFVEEAITADDIGDQYRVVVRLSSSLPKDEIAQTNLFAQLLQSNAISWETFLDQFQKMWGLAADSPEAEIERTFTYMLLRDKSFSEQIARAKADEFVKLMQGLREGMPLADLARSERLRIAQPPPPPAPKPAPPIMRPQTGTPPGLPSSASPPTPDTVAASGNLVGAMNMPGLQGGR